MRLAGLIAVVVLGGVALLLPSPTAPTTDSLVGEASPPVAVCPVDEGSGRSTRIGVLSTVDGPVMFTVFAGGDTAGSASARTGASGSVTIEVDEVAAVGKVGGLLELPVASSAGGVTVTGAESMAAESCPQSPHRLAGLTGGSTASGEEFELHLMNPYAGEATVALTVQTEAGLESNDRFRSVSVPPRSSTVIDLTEVIPGRESISVVVETVTGSVITFGRQTTEGESAVWPAVPPATDWFLPVPQGGSIKRALILNPSNTEIEYQVDFYGPEGLEEGVDTGVIAPRGREAVPLAGLSTDTSAVRVIATAPVITTLWMDSSLGLAATVGATTPATTWMLPGAGTPAGGLATVVLLNPGIDDASVSLRPLRDGSVVREVAVPSDTVMEIGLEPADGYLIESSSPVVTLWTARRGDAATVAIGVPLDDG